MTTPFRTRASLNATLNPTHPIRASPILLTNGSSQWSPEAIATIVFGILMFLVAAAALAHRLRCSIGGHRQQGRPETEINNENAAPIPTLAIDAVVPADLDTAGRIDEAGVGKKQAFTRADTLETLVERAETTTEES